MRRKREREKRKTGPGTKGGVDEADDKGDDKGNDGDEHDDGNQQNQDEQAQRQLHRDALDEPRSTRVGTGTGSWRGKGVRRSRRAREHLLPMKKARMIMIRKKTTMMPARMNSTVSRCLDSIWSSSVTAQMRVRKGADEIRLLGTYRRCSQTQS